MLQKGKKTLVLVYSLFFGGRGGIWKLNTYVYHIKYYIKRLLELKNG